MVVALVPGGESDEAKAARAERNTWLAARDYRVTEIAAAEAEADMTGTLNSLAETLQKS